MKNQIQKAKKWFKSKKAFAVDTAIKVLTAVVLGALVLMGIYGIINGAVMPKTKDKIDSMYAITDAGVDMGGAGGGAGEGTGGGGLSPVVNPELNPGFSDKNILPNAEYYVGVGESYLGNYNGKVSESAFTSAPIGGDVYIYGDYEYRYNMRSASSPNGVSWHPENIQGWGVRVRNTEKTQYGPIMETINGVPVVEMVETFHACKNMTEAPTIPKYVNNMFATFNNCESLKAAPEIPEGVKRMDSAFSSCIKMVTPPSRIPVSVTNMASAFEYCDLLAGTISIDAREEFNPLFAFEEAGNAKGCIILTGTYQYLNEIASSYDTGNVVVKN